MHGPRPLIALAAALTVLGGALAMCFYDGEPYDNRLEVTGRSPGAPTVGSLAGKTTLANSTAATASERTAVPATAPESWRMTGRVVQRREVLRANGEFEEELLPIAKATVLARLERGMNYQEVACAVTGADGHFEMSVDALRDLPALSRIHGKLLVRAWADGHEPSDDKIFALPRSTTQRFRKQASFELESATILAGRVLDAHRRPVHLASVYCEEGFFMQQTDELGRYQLVLDEPGAVQVRATRGGVGYSNLTKVKAARNATVQVPDLVLQEGNVIAGQAVHPDGSPVRNVMLSLYWDKRQGKAPSYDHIESQVDVRTDAAGNFRAGGLVKGRYQVQAFRTSTPKPGTFVHTGTVNARVVIRDRLLVVRVQDGEGRPVPGAEVSLLGWRAGAARQAREYFERHGNLAGVYDSAVEHFELYFEDEATQDWVVEADTFWVLCSATDGSTESLRTVQVTKEQFSYPVEFRLTSSADTGLLKIRIRDTTGRSVPGYCATLHSLTTLRPLPDYGTIYPSRPDVGIRVPAGECLLRVLPMPDRQAARGDHTFGPCLWIERRIQVRRDSEQSFDFVATSAAGLALKIEPAPGKNVGWCPHNLRVTLTLMSGGKSYTARRFLPSDAIAPRWHQWYRPKETALLDCTVPPARYRIELRAPGLVPILRTMDLEAGKIALLAGQFESAR